MFKRKPLGVIFLKQGYGVFIFISFGKSGVQRNVLKRIF